MIIMSTTSNLKIDNTPIILSRGIFDLLRAHIRSRKLSKYNEAKLEMELKSASQVLRSELPEQIVDVNTRVTVKEIATGNTFTYDLVAPAKARRKHQTISILSPIAVAILGYPQGAKVQWEMTDGVKIYQIERVERLA